MDKPSNEWDECLRISNLPHVDELFTAFAQGEATEDTAVMIVREVKREINREYNDVIKQAQDLVGRTFLWRDTFPITVEYVKVETRVEKGSLLSAVSYVSCRWTPLNQGERTDWFSWPLFKDIPEVHPCTAPNAVNELK